MTKLTLADLRVANKERSIEWTGVSKVDLGFRAMELGGEAGEVLNVCKKIVRERLGWPGSRDTVAHLAEELADVIICASLIAMDEEIDLDQAVIDKFNATSDKVGLKTHL